MRLNKKYVTLLTVVTLLLGGFLLSHLSKDKVPLDEKTKNYKKEIPTAYQLTPKELVPTPFDIIADYYEALAGKDWATINKITTPALGAYVRSEAFRKSWEAIVAKNEGLEFVMFLVSNQRIYEDKGEAFALGKVHWRSKTGNIKNYNQMVFLTRTPNGWKIKELRNFTSLETVDDYYQAISDKDWATLEVLTTPKYWKKLVAAGVIQALKKERNKFDKEVYVFFTVDQFWEGKKSAFVAGDVTWKPLSKEFTENMVTIRLRKSGDRWLVDNIRGHWDIKK